MLSCHSYWTTLVISDQITLTFWLLPPLLVCDCVLFTVVQEEAAQRHAEPSYGAELEDSNHFHRTRTYPLLMHRLWVSAWADSLVSVNPWFRKLYFRVSFVLIIKLVVCNFVLHWIPDVRVGPEVITDPAFLITRLEWYHVLSCHCLPNSFNLFLFWFFF